MPSKASEWAAGLDVEHTMRVAFTLNHPDQAGLALVERDGGLYLQITHKGMAVVGGSMRPYEALALARWILDTFGDAPRAEAAPSGAPR